MATLYVSTLAATITLLLTTRPCGAWKKDIKVKYYGTAILRCHENQTILPDTSQVFWITPDATLIRQDTPAGEWPVHVKPVNGTVISMLNVTHISDDMFGYYTCVMVKTSGDVLLARWGLNVDGADFSELEEQYRKNAVVGAIAAGVMIVLIGGACLIWHLRYSERMRGNESASLEEEEGDLKKASNVFHNAGYDESLARVDAEETSEEKTANERAAAGQAQERGDSDSCKL